MELRTVVLLAALCALATSAAPKRTRELLEQRGQYLTRLLNTVLADPHAKTAARAPAFVPKAVTKLVQQEANVLGSCPPGYTGSMCENPICYNVSRIIIHDGMDSDTYGDLVELDVSFTCDDRWTFPVDVSMPLNISVTVQGVNGGRPYAKLYDPAGEVIPPCADDVISDSMTSLVFCSPMEQRGEGLYTVQLVSEQQGACAFEVAAPTYIYPDGGFVTDERDDNVQTFIPAPNQAVGRYPVMNTPSYFAFKLAHDVFPVAPQNVDFYTGGRWSQNHNLLTRYSCFSPHLTNGTFTCTRDTLYHVKVQGVDEHGDAWQRVYAFDCDLTPNPPTGFPPTLAPVSECYNNGILVNGTCYCGQDFEGPQCELKKCFNNGVLDFQNNRCLCAKGYSGDYCQNVFCPNPAPEVYDLRHRVVGFVVRSAQTMNAQMDAILRSADSINSLFESGHAGYIQGWVLSVVQNNGVLFSAQFDRYDQFRNSLQSLTHPPTDTTCDDALYLGISEVLQKSAFQKYPRSPIFIFSDGVANDADDVRYQLLNQLSFYRGQLYFMLSDSVTGHCNIDLNNMGYESMRGVAAFSLGQVVKTDIDNMDIATSSLAWYGYSQDFLLTNDLEDCSRVPKYQTFFVDESVSDVHIIATGTDLTVLVTSPNMTVFSPDVKATSGNLYIYQLAGPSLGAYLVQVTSKSAGHSVCQYRVTATSRYDLFVGVTTDLNSDETTKQPTWREDSHLVAHINNAWTPHVRELHAEAIITTNDRSGAREIVYASSGIYRDECHFFLYFGSFICRVPNMLYYIEVYMTDSAGNTMLRSTTGFCSASFPTPIPPDGCGNGGVMVNGTCICPHHFTGNQCQSIVCENQGTPLFGSCQCPAGFAGTFCQTPACNIYNDYARFDYNHKSLSVLIHDSISTRSVFRTLNDTVARIMDDITYTHPRWFDAFQVLTFDDTSNYKVYVDSNQHSDFVTGIKKAATDNFAHSAYSCNNLTLWDPLYKVLSTMKIEFGGVIFIYVNGLIKHDANNLLKIYDHLESTKTTINVIQTSTAPCGMDILHEQSAILMSLAEFTGGKYILTMANKAGDVFRSLPTLYSSGMVTENWVPDCKKSTSFFFPVDSVTQSVDVTIQGDLINDPVYTAPDGAVYSIFNLWNDIGYGSRSDQIIKPCDDGWDQFDNRCFKFGLSTASWNDAQAACHKEGASMASIFNAQDQQFLNGQSGNINYWTGLNDLVDNGKYVWDNTYNVTFTLDMTGYTNWGAGQPDNNVGKRCVVDQQQQGSGWATSDCASKMHYVCQKHVYNQYYEPRRDMNPLPRGIWQVTVQAEDGCSVAVTAQSDLQVHTEYTSDVHSDYGYNEPFQGTSNNRIIARVTGLLPTTTHSLEYAHFYRDNLTILQAQPMYTRSGCAFEYVSAPFMCPTYNFQMMLSGVDNDGYLYQRVVPVTCLGGPTESECENGSVFKDGKCICPPTYFGEYCEVADCQNGGRVTASLGICECPPDFTGQFCEIPICTRHGNLPDLSDDKRTFLLAVDGVANGMQADFLKNLNTVVTKVITDTNTQYPNWFGQYVGVVFFDAAKTMSTVITKSDPQEFVTAIMAAVPTTPYTTTTPGRQVLTALQAILTAPQVKVRSIGFLITSGVASDFDQYNSVLDAFAQTHTQINTFFIGDASLPGNVTYRHPEVESIFSLTHISGGAVYQTTNATTLGSDWYQTLLTLHYSYYVVSQYKGDCKNYNEYVQVGANSSNMILDIYAENTPTITILDPSHANPPTALKLSSKTNTLETFVPSMPGIYEVELDNNNLIPKPGFCLVNVRGQSGVQVLLAFTQDVEIDNGLHSADAYLFPQAGFEHNAIVATANGGSLTYVQLFDVEERRLQFASPLIKRSKCTFAYISQNVFRCERHTYTVAVDGLDFEGHPFRRMFTIHCVGYIPTYPIPTGTRQPHTEPTRTPAPPAPTYPTCDRNTIVADVILAFDSSLTMDPDVYVDIIDQLWSMAVHTLVGPNSTRILAGTYDSLPHFDKNDFNTQNTSVSYLSRLMELQYEGFTGLDGNNLQGVFDYILNSENIATPFRKEARKIIFFVSSLGWDQGNYHDGKNNGFPDPTPMAQLLAKSGVEFYAIGYGTQANMSQLQKIATKCAYAAKTPADYRDAINRFYSNLCGSTPVC